MGATGTGEDVVVCAIVGGGTAFAWVTNVTKEEGGKDGDVAVWLSS